MFLVVQMKDSNGKDYWHSVPLIPEICELYDAWLVGDTAQPTSIPVFDQSMAAPMPSLGRPITPISKAELKAVFKKLDKLETFEELFK